MTLIEDLVEGLMAIGFRMVMTFARGIAYIFWLERKAVEYSGRALIWFWDKLENYFSVKDESSEGKNKLPDRGRSSDRDTLLQRNYGNKKGKT